MGLKKKKEDSRNAKRFPKFSWIGNRISAADMSRLYNLKQKTKIPITRLVSRAVEEFLDREENGSAYK